MAQATFKAVVVDTLARRIIANVKEPEYLFAEDGDQPEFLKGAIEELWIVARLTGIEDDVEERIARIERERAKEVTA